MASGYRFDFASRSIQGTGIISATSNPDGAIVYVDAVPKDATNTTITNLRPGTYTIRFEKEGYADWEQKVAVEKELVTKIDALLIPLYPSFRPLTYTGVNTTYISPDNQKIAYTVNTNNSSGIWTVNLEERPFNLNRQPQQLLKNTDQFNYSQSKLTWSPTSGQLLIELTDKSGTKTYQLFDLTESTTTPLANIEEISKQWDDLNKLSLNELLATVSDTEKEKITKFVNPAWSPDDQFILYQTNDGDLINYHVYQVVNVNSARSNIPTPTLKVSSTDTVFSINKNTPHQVSWFPNSQHLMLTYQSDANNDDTTIEIIETTGTNRTHLFTGLIKDLQAYPNPNGTKVVILTSFNTQSEAYNLYSIELQ
ncbi:PEGA domain-containing protein [candidate division WWE3 bacterium]|nr:PEGA domain-containing protein [candidate division WWE3 bacterium]